MKQTSQFLGQDGIIREKLTLRIFSDRVCGLDLTKEHLKIFPIFKIFCHSNSDYSNEVTKDIKSANIPK